MINQLKKLIFLSFFCLIPISAQASELELELLNECSLQYGGDSCVSELRITNNTNKDLDGKAVFTGLYNNQPLLKDPVGIDVLFSLSNKQTPWQQSAMIFSDFIIPQGETLSNLEIITDPALNPGPYTFSFVVIGTTEDESYSAPVIVRGGGCVLIPEEEEEEEIPPLTQEELRAMIRDIQWRIIFLIYQLIILILSGLI